MLSQSTKTLHATEKPPLSTALLPFLLLLLLPLPLLFLNMNGCQCMIVFISPHLLGLSRATDHAPKLKINVTCSVSSIDLMCNVSKIVRNPSLNCDRSSCTTAARHYWLTVLNNTIDPYRRWRQWIISSCFDS